MAFTNLGGTPATQKGTAAADVLFELEVSSDVFVDALAGNDVITFTPPNRNNVSKTTVQGGAGDDTVSFTAGGGSVSLTNSLVQGGAGTDTITVQNVTSSSTLRGGAGTDTINTNNTSNGVVNGNKDADTININAGTHATSSIYGGDGADTINFAATTTLAGTVVNGNKGDDTITDNATNGIASMSTSTVFGGAGNDTISLDGAGGGTVGVYVSGDKGNDVITTGAGADTILGGTGDDNITAAGGADSIVGGEGADTIATGAGNDTVTGGAGADSITLAGGTNRIIFGSSDGVKAASVTAFTTAGIVASFNNGIEQIAAFVSGTDDIAFGLGTNTAITQVNDTAAQVLTAGTLFYVRGTLTGNTFTSGSLDQTNSLGSGIVFAGNNNTLTATLTSQTHAVYVAALPVAAGDIV